MRADRGALPGRGRSGASTRDTRPLGAFFALLFLHAGLIVLAQAAIGTGRLPVPRLVFWHGHELLLGFAAGMMGGYLTGLRDAGGLRWLLAAWLTGRAGILLAMAEGGGVWVLLALLYPLVLVLHATRPFLRRGLRLRNRMLALPPFLLLLAEGLFAGSVLVAGTGAAALMLAAAAVIGMMLLVGGRLAMAAINGGRQKRGLPRLSARRDALFEYAAALGVAGWLTAELAGVGQVSRVMAGLVVLLGIMRIRLWQPGPALGIRRVRLYLLGLGWVLAGLAWRAGTAASGPHAALVALHPAFVGGLATLAGSVSLQVRLQRVVPLAELPAAVEGAAGLFSLAALARIAGVVSGPWPWLMIAAFAWGAGGLVIIHGHFAGPHPAADGKR